MATFVPPSQQQQNTNSRRERGTGFTNLNRILGANTGAGERIGGAMVGNVQNQAQGFQNQFETAQNKFSEDKLKARTQAQDMLNPARSFQRQAGETDEAYTSRLADLNADQNMADNLQNASYTGPTDIENKQGLLNKATGLRSTGQMLGQNAGRFNLLRSTVATPGQYTMGQQSLDNTLLGQSRSALDTIKNTQKQLSNTAGRAVSQANLANQLAEGERVAVDNQRTGIAKDLIKEGDTFQKIGENQANNLQKLVDQTQFILSLPSLDKGSEAYSRGVSELFDGNLTPDIVNQVMQQSGRLGLFVAPQTVATTPNSDPNVNTIGGANDLSDVAVTEQPDPYFGVNQLYGSDSELNDLLRNITFDRVAGRKILDDKQQKAFGNINTLAKLGMTPEDIAAMKVGDISQSDEDFINQSKNRYDTMKQAEGGFNTASQGIDSMLSSISSHLMGNKAKMASGYNRALGEISSALKSGQDRGTIRSRIIGALNAGGVNKEASAVADFLVGNSEAFPGVESVGSGFNPFRSMASIAGVIAAPFTGGSSLGLSVGSNETAGFNSPSEALRAQLDNIRKYKEATGYGQRKETNVNDYIKAALDRLQGVA